MSGTPSTSLLRARGLRREYGREAGLVRAVDAVDLDVAAGETLAVMGPSGCGKSTLLHLLGGLDRPSGGKLWLAGQRIDQMTERAMAALRRDAVGFVFQAFHLMDELTAAENAELPALLAGRTPRAARQRALDLLEQVGLADRATFLPSAGHRLPVRIHCRQHRAGGGHTTASLNRLPHVDLHSLAHPESSRAAARLSSRRVVTQTRACRAAAAAALAVRLSRRAPVTDR